jgi:hypothetical protein
MKKALVTMLAGVMIFLASGCGGSAPATPPPGDTKPADGAAAPAADAKPAEGETK